MSLAQNIREILAGRRTGLTVGEIAPECEGVPTSTQVALAVHSMMKAGGLIREGEKGSYRYRLPPAGTTVRTHTFDEEEAPAEQPLAPAATPKPRAKRKASVEPVLGIVDLPPAPAAAPPSDLDLAITETGVLGLRRGDSALFLQPAEVQRVTAFLQRVGATA